MRFSKRFLKWSMLVAIITVLSASTLSATQPTLAQAPRGRPSIGVQAFNACYTTNVSDVASKALGMTTPALLTALVSGQSLQQIATTANVDIQTVNAAIQTARKPEIDQAVTDRVLTQAEATAMESTSPATRPAPGGAGGGNGGGAGGFGGGRGAGGVPQQAQFPDISTFSNLLQSATATQAAPGAGARGGFGGFGGFGGINLAMFNLVKPYAVIAQALNMKCTTFLTTLITPPGRSIVSMGTDQNVTAQALTDALTKAYKDALALDVTNGVITQAQSDQLTTFIDKAVSDFINNPTPMQPRPQLQATQQAAAA